MTVNRLLKGLQLINYACRLRTLFRRNNSDVCIGIDRIYASIFGLESGRRFEDVRTSAEQKLLAGEQLTRVTNPRMMNRRMKMERVYTGGFNIPPLKAVVSAVVTSTRDYQRLILFAKCAACIRRRNPIKTNLVKICMRPDDLSQSIKPQFFRTIRFFLCLLLIRTI